MWNSKMNQCYHCITWKIYLQLKSLRIVFTTFEIVRNKLLFSLKGIYDNVQYIKCSFLKKKEDVKQLTIVLIYFVVSDLLNDQWVGRVRILK